MADNVAVTAGSGTTIATDDVGGVHYQKVKLAIGAADAANLLAVGAGAVDTGTPRVTLASDDPAVAHLATIKSPGLSASATFTPAAASHVANDCNGAAAEIALAAISGSHIMITDAEFEIDGGTAEASAFRLYLYNVTPPSATADDGAWDLPSGDRASFLGYIDLGTAVDLGSTCWIESHGINKIVKLSGTSVFAYLVNLTTVTPAAIAHIVKLKAVQL